MANKKKEDKKIESKEELKDIKEEISIYAKSIVEEEVEKNTKKLLRYKNSIIMRKNITIILLILVCVFLGYNLYTISDISIDIKKTNADEQETTKTSEEKEEREDYSEYNYLFDKITISENNAYKDKYYNDGLTDEVKMSITLSNIDSEKIHTEDNSSYIEKNDFLETYQDIFTGEFNPKSFKYNGINISFLSSKEIFIGEKEITKEETNIKREIIDKEETDDEIKLTTVEGVVKDNKLYNVISGKNITKYKNDSIINYADSLTKLAYTFKKEEEKYKLVSIEK